MLKKVEIDRFNTPYTVNVSGPLGDVHQWNGLSRQQCLLYGRWTRISVNANPNNTILTFSIGNGQMSFSSPKAIYWEFTVNYFMAEGTVIDLSHVKRFYVDVDHIPDIAEMYARDKWFNSGVSGPSGQPKGIYFNRLGLGGGLDWKNITNIEFRLDFASIPNPLSVTYSRLYATLEPGLSGPGTGVQPTGIGG